jgi:hypothetical protein
MTSAASPSSMMRWSAPAGGVWDDSGDGARVLKGMGEAAFRIIETLTTGRPVWRSPQIDARLHHLAGPCEISEGCRRYAPTVQNAIPRTIFPILVMGSRNAVEAHSPHTSPQLTKSWVKPDVCELFTSSQSVNRGSTPLGSTKRKRVKTRGKPRVLPFDPASDPAGVNPIYIRQYPPTSPHNLHTGLPP